MRYVMTLLLVMIFVLSACASSPKSKAREWADRFPEEIGEWERDDKVVELSQESQSGYGYVTLTYEGRRSSAYLTIAVYGTESAADVVLDGEMLDWQVQGARFEAERVKARKGFERIDVATMAGGLLAYYQIDETVMELRIIPEDPADEVPEEDIALFFATMVEIAKGTSDEAEAEPTAEEES